VGWKFPCSFSFVFTSFSLVVLMADLSQYLHALAAQYETVAFIDGDPSWFMHQVTGSENCEVTAFVASCLSYGNRRQFMPKIQSLLDYACGDMYGWVLSGEFETLLHAGDNNCFYRLYTCGMMNGMLSALQEMLCEYGSMGNWIRSIGCDGCCSAVGAITAYFAAHDRVGGIVPKNAVSACKRVCMFLRWMVRDGSPVDLGLWSDVIDKRTLIIPMDTHVLQQSVRLGLMQSRTASMSAAIKLSCKLAEFFPDDPMKGDFALFGYGVNNK